MFSINWSSSRNAWMICRCLSGSCSHIPMISSRRDVSSAVLGVMGVSGTAPPSAKSSCWCSLSSCERREKPSPERSNEPMSRMGKPTIRCSWTEKGLDWLLPAASRAETVVSRWDARMLRSQRLTRQKPSNEVMRINQPENNFFLDECDPSGQKRETQYAPMVMRKKESQSDVASFVKFTSSMVAPGIVPDGIPEPIVVFSFR